jgi:hypothetical protein
MRDSNRHPLDGSDHRDDPVEPVKMRMHDIVWRLRTKKSPEATDHPERPGKGPTHEEVGAGIAQRLSVRRGAGTGDDIDDEPGLPSFDELQEPAFDAAYAEARYDLQDSNWLNGSSGPRAA